MNNLNSDKGYTLIELVLVIVIIGVIMGTAMLPLIETSMGWVAISNRKDINDASRTSLDRIARELRNIRRTGDNTPSVTSAGQTAIIFEDSSAETVSFSWAGTGSSLLRGTDTLIPDNEISSFELAYYDENNNQLSPLPLSTTDIENIKRIMITIQTEKENETLSTTTQAFIRSLSGY